MRCGAFSLAELANVGVYRGFQVDMARLALVRKRREEAEARKAAEAAGDGESKKEKMEKEAKAKAGSGGPQKLNPLEVSRVFLEELETLCVFQKCTAAVPSGCQRVASSTRDHSPCC